jgi:mannose-6-phosphate isomerase-like protein (cupin superfamily)
MTIQAKRFAPDEGKSMQVGRMTFHFKMMAEDTEGAYSAMEAVVPPDSGSGLHRHWSYDESAFVAEGRFDCHIDGKQVTLQAGESVYWPRGAIHKFRCLGPEDGRILFICSPGKIFENFVEEIVGSNVGTGVATSGPALDFRAIASNYGIEFFG